MPFPPDAANFKGNLPGKADDYTDRKCMSWDSTSYGLAYANCEKLNLAKTVELPRFICYLCGTDSEVKQLNTNTAVDHIFPWAKLETLVTANGGKSIDDYYAYYNDADNLILTCSNCNSSKQDVLVSEAIPKAKYSQFNGYSGLVERGMSTVPNPKTGMDALAFFGTDHGIQTFIAYRWEGIEKIAALAREQARHEQSLLSVLNSDPHSQGVVEPQTNGSFQKQAAVQRALNREPVRKSSIDDNGLPALVHSNKRQKPTMYACANKDCNKGPAEGIPRLYYAKKVMSPAPDCCGRPMRRDHKIGKTNLKKATDQFQKSWH